MPSPLLATKFYVPRPRTGLVLRPSLTDRLRRWHRGEVDPHLGSGRVRQIDTLGRVAGQADGRFGHRMAVARCRRRSSEPILASPDRRAADGDPGVGTTSLALLESPDRSIETVLAPLLNELDALAHGIVLVLDDYHVIDAQDIQVGMSFLLDHLPAHMHLVIATRADPALPLARLRARGELVEIRAGDLRFTPDEAAAYLNGVMGLGSDGRGRRRAGGTDRRLDRRAPAGRPVDAGAGRHRRLHRELRGRRPLHRRLPRRGGPPAPARRRPELPAADLDPRPA